MHQTFGDVLWIVLGVGVLASIWAMKGAAKEWEDYNERGLYMESLRAARRMPVSESVRAAEAAAEIREMIEARNARRVRRGDAPLDVEAEIARLTASAPPSRREPDPELVDEVRSLVQLRNARRAKKGLEPLDEDAEVRRELDELEMLRH